MLLHLTTGAEWEAARRSGRHAPPSLAAEGFVHCSTPAQLAGVVERFFQGRADLVLLVLDPARLAAEVRWEDSEGTGERFPHVYGPLPLDAVLESRPLALDAAGRVALPPVAGTGLPWPPGAGPA